MRRPNLAAEGYASRLRDIDSTSTKSYPEVLAGYEGAVSWLTEQANPAGAKGMSVPNLS
jgi:hypothetical protein